MTYQEQCDGPDLDSAEDADIQREHLGFRIAAYLREKGWKHTSSTPGCFWLWEKTLADGRVVLVNQDMAIGMQRDFEDAEEPASEDGGYEDRNELTNAVKGDLP